MLRTKFTTAFVALAMAATLLIVSPERRATAFVVLPSPAASATTTSVRPVRPSSASVALAATKKKEPKVEKGEEEAPAAAVEAMRKKDIVAALSEELGSTKAEAEGALTAVLEIIAESVVQGKKVSLPGFGTFEPRPRAARKGRNPKTGEEMEIKAFTSVGFSASKTFKDRVNLK